jgi:hypothetical protein
MWMGYTGDLEFQKIGLLKFMETSIEKSVPSVEQNTFVLLM